MDKSIEKMVKPVEKVFRDSVIPFLQQPVIFHYVKIISVVAIVCSLRRFENVSQILCHPLMLVFSTFLSVLSVTSDIRQAVIVSIIVYVLSEFMKIYKEKMTLISNTPDIYQGCKNIKAADVRKMFNDDDESMNKILYEIGVPTNVTLTDDSAPLVATYLINNRRNVSDTCAPPI